MNEARPQRQLSATAFAASRRMDYPVINAGDVVEINGRLYSDGSVVSYSMQNNSCPVLAVEKAIARNEKLWWLNPKAVTISNPPMPRETPVGYLNAGDVVKMEGRFLRVEATWNDNFNLIPMSADDLAEAAGIDVANVG